MKEIRAALRPSIAFALPSYRKPLTILFIAGIISVAILIVSTPVSALVTLEEINPTNSDLDAGGNPDPANLQGPDPDGASAGRVNGLASVAGNNDIFYAASEWGGLFKTIDGGLTWFRLNGHLPVATWDVEVDPNNPSIVYATSFYDGRLDPKSGIQVSYDGGNTWLRMLTSYPDPDLEGTSDDNTPSGFVCNNNRRTEPSAFGISSDQDNSQNVYIGTNCGLAISNDSGSTWDFVDPTPADTASDIWDVVVHNGIIDVCGNDGHFRSTDGGSLWTVGSALPGGNCTLAISPDEDYVLFATVGTSIFESDDAGASWTALPNPRPQGRIPVIITNNRSGTNFDLWFGDVSLHRRSCTTPSTPAPGGAIRCPSVPNGTDGVDNDGDGNTDEADETWFGPFTRSVGAHDDAGDLVFDTQAADDACPMIFSSDGGVYYNTDTGAGCHNPNWEQPNVTPRAQWLFAMDGADQPGENDEDLYFGTQDIGSWATTDAGAANPSWSNKDCCDVFDIVADSNRVLYTVCCFGGARANRLFMRNSGMTGGGEINNYPPGNLPGFRPDSIIDQFGDDKYVLVTRSGVFITDDITDSPITWTQLDTGPANACGVQASVDGLGTPTFYVQAGICNERTMGNNGDRLWKYTGTDPGGSWVRIDTNLPGASQGVGIFAVDSNDPNELYASNIRTLLGGGPQMVFSNDGGLTWENDAELDDMMTAGGFFKYRTERGPSNFTRFRGYPQPTLLAVDPEAPEILVAGGRDSGVFISGNSGETWTLVSDPFESDISGIPHVPRPWFAYFDHDTAGQTDVYIGTQGRGVWRLSFTPPPVADADGPYITFEGVDIALDGTGSNDPDGGPLDYAWDLDDDGAFDDAGTSTPTFDMVGQDGVFPIALRVTDSDTFTDIDETNVIVLNVAPGVSIGSDAPKDEGSILTVSGTVTDPGWLELLTATIDWDNGTPVQPITGTLENVRPDATLVFNTTHAYGDNDNYNIEVCGFDDDTSTCDTTAAQINNVPPDVNIDPAQITDINEGDFINVSANFTDPGWLDTYTSLINWGTGASGPGTLAVNVEGPPEDQGTVSGAHQYGDNGNFPVTVTVTDDDGGAGMDSFSLNVHNVDPTAEIDESDAILINGIPTFLAHAGEPLDFSGRSQDPGSDDLSLSWDWDDGIPSPDITTMYLVNPPNPDPFPSPSVQPRDVTDTKTHAFADACLYIIEYKAVDDDGGEGLDEANVIIVGNADLVRSAGYWQHQYKGKGHIDFDQETLECYLAIVGYTSLVFNEIRDASTIEKAFDVLFVNMNNGSASEAFDRQLLAAWLNFANGAIEYDEMVDSNGDGIVDSTFGVVVAIAEVVRLNPASTKAQLEAQKDILERIN